MSTFDRVPRVSISVPVVNWQRLATSAGIAFWGVTGLLIPITLAMVAIATYPRSIFLIAGCFLLYAALVAVIYVVDDDVA